MHEQTRKGIPEEEVPILVYTLFWYKPVDHHPVISELFPFEKLVGGISNVSFSDHLQQIFTIFWVYLAVILFLLTQCKKKKNK